MYPVYLVLPADKGNGFYSFRLRNASGQFYDFTNTVWSSTAVAGSIISLTEQGTTGLYTASVTLPTGGPFLAACYITSTGVVVATESTALDGTLSANAASLATNAAAIALIPTTPLLAGDSRLPATLIAAQADVAVVYTDTQAIRAKTDSQSGPWGASVPGAYLINIQTTIAGSDPPVPIPDVMITLLNADGSVLLDSRKADSMGQASFPRDNGTYIVRNRLAGYSFDDDTAVVNNADVDHTCEGTALVLPANPDPDTQLVYFPDTVAGQIVRAYPTSGQLTSQTLVDKQRTEGLTIAGTTGVSLALLRGVEYTVQVVGWGELTFTVTTASERYFAQYVAESEGA